MFNPFRRSRYRDYEIAPDEIFLDATNLPDFDRSQFEGRLEQPISRTTYLALGGVICMGLLILLGQAWKLEVMNGKAYAEQSEKNVLRPQTIFATRGAVTDRNGVPLISNEPGDGTFAKRVYRAPGFSALLGYVSYPKKDRSGNYYETEVKGLAGIESAFDEELSGENGSLLIEEDARGNVVSQGSLVPPMNGQTLQISIDADVQEAFYHAIADTAESVPYQSGSGILMDVNTGEIHALVSYPEYDSNVLASGGPSETIKGYLNDSRQPYLNRPVAGLYTPGSIIKPIEAAGAFTDGIISPEKTIFSSGQISVPNPYDPDKPTIFRDWKALGAMDMRAAIAWSSDVYFYSIGGGFGDQKGLGIDRINYWFSAFGLTTKTGIELSGENVGFVPTPAWKEETFGEPWRIGNTYHTAIGQYAMQITPLEAARGIAAVANGGKLIKPTLLVGNPPVGETIAVSPEGLKIAREGMRLGTTEGTSIGLNDLSFVEVAGKTGTAQLGFHNELQNAWAVGFFPYDKPKYVFVVVMEKAKAGTTQGGIYVMHQVLRKMRETAPEYFGIAE